MPQKEMLSLRQKQIQIHGYNIFHNDVVWLSQFQPQQKPNEGKTFTLTVALTT